MRMDKMFLKSIEILKVVKNNLSSRQDMSGEYSTNCDIDFILSHPITFNIFDKEFVIDRVKMYDWYGDEIGLKYANAEKSFCCFNVSKVFAHKIYFRIMEEQKEHGVLNGWSLEDSIMEMLRDESFVSSCY